MKVMVQVWVRVQGSGVRSAVLVGNDNCHPEALTNLIIDLHELSLEHQLWQLVEPNPSDQRIAVTTKGLERRAGNWSNVRF